MEKEFYMREAILEARKAALIGEVPVGAIIVKDGEIIARAHNLVETNHSSSAHAEMLAIAEAEKKLGKWLTGCEIYVTLEPCAMCAGSMVLARIKELNIGAMDPKNGACGTIFNVANNDKLNHRITVNTGMLGEECGSLLTDFFKEMRLHKDALKRNK